MAILVTEGAEPLSDASTQFASEGLVRNAQSDAGRVLRLELTRYCRGELHGRSFLIAGHRGSGKTTLVADALDKVLRLSRRSDEGLLRPLPIFLHGPSLFESDADESPPESQRPAAQANAALKQIILGIHRAVVKEFGRAYRARLVTSEFAARVPVSPERADRFGSAAAAEARPSDGRQRSQADRVAFAELAAQFEIELAEDPSAARLREFWEMAEALQCGVLFDGVTRIDQGSRELVALNGMCNAHQRISGEISAQDTTARGEENVSETSSGHEARGAELAKPLASVIAGAAVAGGAAAGAHSLGLALAAGLGSALVSSMFFKSTRTHTAKSGRQVDTTFIPDLSLRTLDRILPTLLQRLRDAGLAPVLVIDELDKVRGLPDRLVGMIHFLKKLVAENVFTCFLTDRGYLEHLRMQGRDSAYGRAYSYFSHPLLITWQPADFAGYLDKVLVVERGAAGAPGAPAADDSYQSSTILMDGDTVDLEVLKWVLRHRSQMHALALTREIASMRGDANRVQIAPGVVRSEYTYRIDLTFQVAIELQLAQPHVRSWLRQRPDMSQTLLDAMYFPSRQWLQGRDVLASGADRDEFHAYLVERMNLDELVEDGAQAAAAASTAAQALSRDDRAFLDAVVDDMVRFLGPATDVPAAMKAWGQLPPIELSPRVDPGLPVVQALLLGDRSLLVERIVDGQVVEYGWRYLPSGVLRATPASAPALDGDANEEVTTMIDELLAGSTEVAESVRAAGQSLEDMSAHEAAEFIAEVHANLSRMLFPAAPLPGSPGPVFEMLCDRMRVLPTTPAWPRVQSAIANLALIRGGGGNQATRTEDIRAAIGFAEMLRASRRALIRTLVMAAYCGSASLPEREDEGLANGMDALSSGQRFATLDAEGVEWAMERLETAATVTQSERLGPLMERAVDRVLDDLALVGDVTEAFRIGSNFFVQSPREAFTREAWEALKTRLETFVVSGDSPPAALEETLCAIRVTRPATLVTLDLQAMTLAGWTSTLMRSSTATLHTRPVLGVPTWLIGFALNRLGAGTLAVKPRTRLVEWALGTYAGDAAQSGEVFRLINISSTASPASEVTNRVAVCVTTGADAPMGGWPERPRRGLVLAVKPEDLSAAMSGPVKAVGRPILIAAAQGPGVRVADREIRRIANERSGTGIVWVYRRRAAQMLEPSLIGPQRADDVLEIAPSSEQDES